MAAWSPPLLLAGFSGMSGALNRPIPTKSSTGSSASSIPSPSSTEGAEWTWRSGAACGISSPIACRLSIAVCSNVASWIHIMVCATFSPDSNHLKALKGWSCFRLTFPPCFKSSSVLLYKDARAERPNKLFCSSVSGDSDLNSQKFASRATALW